MKKTAGGICALLLLSVTLFSLRGGVLKAGELETSFQTSEQLETFTEPSSENVQEVPVAKVEEPLASQAVEPTTEPIKEVVSEESSEPAEESSDSSVSTSSETSTSESTSESAVESTTESTVSSSSESTTSSTSSSITETSTSSTTTQESTTSNSSTSSEEAIPSTEPNTTGSSTEESRPTSSSESVVPPVEAPAAAAPTVQVPQSAQPTVQTPSFTNEVQDQALSAVSTLNLPKEWRAEKLAESDLGLFELPLLSSFERKEEAALIYGAIQQVGQPQEDTLTSEEFFQQLYLRLFGTMPTEHTQKTQQEELTAGMLLYQEQKLIGLYLGNDSYLTLADVEIEEEADSEDSAEQKESEEPIKERQAVVRLLTELEEDLFTQSLPDVELTSEGQQVLASYPAAKDFQASETTQNFVDSISEEARSLGLEYDVFASVMIAQAILESGSGTSGLSLPPHYNLFGVKGTYQGQSVSFATNEDRGNGELYQIQSAFRKYPNYAASLGDYVSLIRGGISGNQNFYQPVWRSEAKNYLNATSSLTGSYATDTEYNQKLNSLIAVYHLTEFDRPKATDSSVFIKGKAEIPAEYKARMKFPDYDGKNYNSSGSYPVGQCTWYAYNRVKQLGKSVDEFMGNGGEWGATGKRLGYKVSQQPKAGWLVSFSPGTAGSDSRYGHVAFVEAVGPEGILISEGNVYGGTIISYRVIGNELARSNQVSYIQPK